MRAPVCKQYNLFPNAKCDTRTQPKKNLRAWEASTQKKEFQCYNVTTLKGTKINSGAIQKCRKKFVGQKISMCSNKPRRPTLKMHLEA